MASRSTKRSPRARPLTLREAGVPYEGPVRSLDRLVDVLGNNRTAELLGVSASQPSRWRRGLERMKSESQRRVLDLDYALSRLLLLYPSRQAEIWLRSHNGRLGARPLDVLRIEGASRVVEAIDAEAQGAPI